MNTCTQCQKPFEVLEIQKEYLKKTQLPEPQKCPSCRKQARFAFRNERTLYHRKCDLSGKQIISIYHPESPYLVYSPDEWHSDKWDGADYWRDFDFNRSFFEQFNELMLSVPKISRFASQNENSEFTNGAQQDKNCYMIFVSDHNEDSYYSYAIESCSDCIECLNCYKCELCIQCIDCSTSYNLAYCERTHNCSDSSFLYDCKNCKNCFGCFGLRGKEYYIFNQAHSQEDYEAKLKQLKTGNHYSLEKIKAIIAQKVTEQQIHPHYDGNNNENCTGDHIIDCKNCFECYDSGNLEDCAHLIFSFNSKDCFDGHVVVDKCELCYETISTINQYNTQFTFVSFYSKNSQYLDHCHFCEDCFACSGLKKKKYCIFNKQYSKEDYEIMRDKIIRHMKKTGEWGQSFPIGLSPFGYNETVAQEFYPISKSEAEKKGWKWFDEDSIKSAYQGPKNEVPEDIAAAENEVTQKIFQCECCAKPFKIIPQEFNLYRKHQLPLPRKCFNDRHLERLKKRNPRKLWDRECEKCSTIVKSSYAKHRPEKVYCKDCYTAALY